MKKVIEQIRKIKGVVTVDKAGENMAVVVFESKKEPWQGRQYVKCTTEKEYEFVKNTTGLMEPSSIDFWVKYPCVSTDGKDCFSSDTFPERAYRVIDFKDYLEIFLLESKWTAFNKPKSLTPEELVDGRIYVDEKCERVFRFQKLNGHKKASLYSQLIRNFSNGNCLNSTDGYLLEDNKIRHASIDECKELIRFEIERNYFHELK